MTGGEDGGEEDDLGAALGFGGGEEGLEGFGVGDDVHEEHAVYSGEGGGEGFGLLVVAGDDLYAVGPAGDFCSVADEDADGFALGEELSDDLASDVSGGTCDEIHRQRIMRIS